MKHKKTAITLAAIIAVLLAGTATALQIIAPASPAREVTPDSAEIVWTTDIPATSRVEYGTTKELGPAKEDPALVTQHSVMLADLLPGTTYYYKIISEDQNANKATADKQGNLYRFVTTAGKDRAPARFENITPTALTDESTTIKWDTTEDATSQVHYGLTAQLGITEESDTLKTHHAVTFRTKPLETYYYRTGGCDKAGNCANSSLHTVETGAPITELKVVAELPEVINRPAITIKGKTKPFADIHVFVNDARTRVYKTAGDGTFALAGIPLPAKNNKVRLEAWEENQKAVQEYDVAVDTYPPEINLEKELPDAIAANSFELRGKSDEPVRIFYKVVSKEDTKAPEMVEGLAITPYQNDVDIEWLPSTETDLLEYAVYRDDIRIAVTKNTKFRDAAVGSGKTHKYSVTAVDTSCNEGPRASKGATTKSGGEFLVPAAKRAELSCQKNYEMLATGGPFSIPLDFTAKYNDVIVKFVDAAGNRKEIGRRVVVDTQPPVIEANLDEISPTYIPEVRIKGRISEPGTVFVFLDEEDTPAGYETTEDGSFSIKVQLKKIREKEREKENEYEFGTSWINNIRIEAVDAAGLRSALGPVPVEYTLCGQGSWYSVNLGEPAPAVLIPRLMLQGVQQFTMPFNASYRGGQEATLQSIQAMPLQLSPAVAKDYDHDWVTVYTQSRAATPTDHIGIVQVQFNPFEPIPERPDAPVNEKERALSEHRKDECTIPEAGCVKLNLMLEIRFQEKIPFRRTDPRTQEVREEFKLENRVQKICMPVEIQIDTVIPEDAIPDKFFERTSEWLEKGIEYIDKVLEPVSQVTEYTTYGCLASMGWLYIQNVLEKWYCAGTDKTLASIGMCEAVDDSAQKLKCEKCSNHIKKMRKFESNVLYPVCDRIECPSAPSLQTHIKDNIGNAVPVKVDNSKVKVDAKWLVNDKVFAGSDCGFALQIMDTPKKLDTKYSAGNKIYGIKELYDFAKTEARHNGLPSKKDCEEPIRPAHPVCCGIDYQRQWSSACGLGTAIGTNFDFFDELEKSTCLAAQRANKDPGFKCTNTWNAAAGFCAKEPLTPHAESIPTSFFWKPAKPGALENRVYVFIIPVGAKTAITRSGLSKQHTTYNVFRGYAMKTLEFEEKQTSLSKPQQQKYRLTDVLTAVPEKQIRCFTEADETKQKACFVEQFCKGPVETISGSCNVLALEYYDRIQNIVNVPEDDYIVRPENDFFTAIQCLCLPAVKGYLELWRNLMAMVRACFATVAATGSGTPGACEALLSQTVCDLLYEAISCTTNFFSSEGIGHRVEIGIFGDVIGALTSAGTDVSTAMQSRYGDGPLTKTLFAEKKLVNSVCLWAFTGTWGLDIEAITKTTVEDIPVDTIAQLTTCRRTFAGFDPTTQPAGLTTWNYRIAGMIAPGADIRYRLKLKCSAGYNCPENQNSKCDCEQPREFVISPPELGTGQLKRLEMFSFDAFHTIRSQQSPDSFARYDTAILEWEWQDPQTNQMIRESTECKIRETEGGQAPAFCTFDISTGSFRCRVFEAPYGIAIKEIKPAYEKDMFEFALGQKPKFDITVSQEFPAEPSKINEARKYIIYSITDRKGNVVKLGNAELHISPQEAGTKGKTLATSGTYSTTTNEFGPLEKDLRLNKEDIKRHSAAASFAPPQKMWPVQTARKWVKSIQILDDNKNPVKTNYDFVIEFPEFMRNPEVFRIYQLKTPDESANGFMDREKKQVMSGEFETGETITVEFSVDEFSVIMQVDKPKGFSITNDKTLQIRVGYVKPAEKASICKEPYTPVTWYANFIIIDADRFGRPAVYPETQVAVDPLTGLLQNKTIPFKIICAEIKDIKDKSKEQQGGI